MALFSYASQCVPLLRLEARLGWEFTLDEYAVGLRGRAAIRDVEDRFGDRWRLLGPKEDSLPLRKLFSTKNQLYQTFSREYHKRGAPLGGAGVLSELQSKYANKGGATALYSLAKKDSPCHAFCMFLLQSIFCAPFVLSALSVLPCR